jgi:hypothetical protein
MQTKVGRLIILFSVFFCTIAHADDYSSNYVGIDYKYRSMKGRKYAGYDMGKVLNNSYPSAVVYFGHRFDNDTGLTLGLEQSGLVDKNYSFGANETFLGANQKFGDRTMIESRIQSIHFDLNGFADVNSYFEAVGQLGVALMRNKMDARIYSGGVGTDMAPGRRYRFIPRVGFGLQHIGKRKLGIRALVNWEGTNMYRMKLTDSDGIRRSIRPFQQSWSFSIGVVGKF